MLRNQRSYQISLGVKFRSLLWGGLLAVLCTLPISAQDAEPPVTWGGDVALANQYVWRGFQLNDSPSLQPGLWLSFYGVTVSSWSNLSKDGPFGQQWTEHDLSIDYTRGITKSISLSTGYINYAFPDLATDQFANEFYGGISYERAVAASFTVYQNVGLSTGTYFGGSLSKTFQPFPKLTVTPGVSLGFNREMFIPESTFSDAVFSLSASVPLGRSFTLSPVINFSKSLDKTYFNDHWYGGVSVAWSH